VTLEADQFSPTRPELTRSRGVVGAPSGTVVARGHLLSFIASALKTAYGSESATSGDWRAEGVLRYQSRGLFRIGVGAEVGKFDEPYSDPSFIAVGVFVEPGINKFLTDRWMGSLGARYGWAHERVGDEADGLWAWGWQAGAVAGVDYRLGASTGAGMQLEVTRLSLQQDENLTVPPSGLKRQKWRYNLSLTLRLDKRRKKSEINP
jgi:hypothetical protein